MCETSTDFLLFLVSVIRSEIRWAKQVQDMLVSPFFCKAVDLILSNRRIKRTFIEKQPHISKFVGVLYDTGSFVFCPELSPAITDNNKQIMPYLAIPFLYPEIYNKVITKGTWL